MTPEQKARLEIDRQLCQCGWIVQDFREMDISAGLGVAVREFPLTTGSADYLLYADGMAIGIVEAKPEGHSLTGVEIQSDKYAKGLPEALPTYHRPLPFAYESTGVETQFTNSLEPDARSREVFSFHRPEELIRLAKLEAQVRTRLRALPELCTERLWPIQIDTLQKLERSFAANRPKALIQMATGTGKTFTAVTFCYRLVKFAGARRILYLVDRNTLGRQTYREFDQYVSPYSNYRFTEEFNVQRLTKNTIDSVAKVCITTIQRLYSLLQGEEDLQEETEEGSLFESPPPILREPVPVAYNPRIPIETFDFIVVDECHRSIYNLWRQVLEYFDASLIGLTATPTAQTIGFFDGNLVQDYSHERAVADGINVGYDVYRIETEITKDGATLRAEPGLFVPRRDRRTRRQRLAELDEDLPYTANQLDRDVVAKDQIRLVIRTFRDRLFTEIFPGREDVPKTLVFAKTDLHADDIVRVVREEFGKGNEFCQKITSKTTGKKPEDLLTEFRTAYNPRIAVTVDLVATGTDVKPLECIIFMRSVKSLGYFEQMKGRGSRVIDEDTLESVTPGVRRKTRFVIVDAVGVCEQDKTPSRPLDRKPSVPLDKVMSAVGAGAVDSDLVSTLAARLARLDREIDDNERERIARNANGDDLKSLSSALLASIDPDRNAMRAAERFELADGQEPTHAQLAQVEQEEMRKALKPFLNPALRNTILEIRASLEQTIDEVTPDRLVRAEFDRAALDKAKSLVRDFRQFIADRREEIEALRLLYSKPYRSGLRYHHVRELAEALRRAPLSADIERVWNAYGLLEPERVKRRTRNQLADVISLVRHALAPESTLVPFAETVDERYLAWLARQEHEGAHFSSEQRRWLDAIKDHIASSLTIEAGDFDDPPLSQLGGLGKVYEVFGDRLSELLDQINEALAA